MARAFVALLVLSACLVDVSLSATMKADSKIKHIVILMQENRSFDHFLGFLKRQNAEINGLNGNETQPLSTSDPFSPVYTVSDDSGYVTDPDPGHGVSAVTEQAFGSYDADDTVDPAPMNGFVQNYERLIPGDGKAIMRYVCIERQSLLFIQFISFYFPVNASFNAISLFIFQFPFIFSLSLQNTSVLLVILHFPFHFTVLLN